MFTNFLIFVSETKPHKKMNGKNNIAIGFLTMVWLGVSFLKIKIIPS